MQPRLMRLLPALLLQVRHEEKDVLAFRRVEGLAVDAREVLGEVDEEAPVFVAGRLLADMRVIGKNRLGDQLLVG